MKNVTVRVVTPTLILAGAISYAAATALPNQSGSEAVPLPSLLPGASPASSPSRARDAQQPAAEGIGLLRVDYEFERQGRAASNQFAIWIETAAGEYVDTVIATSWIANGGWTRRPMSMPEWRASSNWADATTEQIEAVSRPAPRSGHQTVYWDGLDANGVPAAAGEYVLRVEGNVEWENKVMFSAPFTIGEVPVEAAAREALNEQPQDTMLSDVRIAFLPGEPFVVGMRTEFTRGS